jgi:hypothetical protein
MPHLQMTTLYFVGHYIQYFIQAATSGLMLYLVYHHFRFILLSSSLSQRIIERRLWASRSAHSFGIIIRIEDQLRFRQRSFLKTIIIKLSNQATISKAIFTHVIPSYSFTIHVVGAWPAAHPRWTPGEANIRRNSRSTGTTSSCNCLAFLTSAGTPKPQDTFNILVYPALSERGTLPY